ncbi:MULTISPECIES: DsrE family protein [unclassified Halomonas]|uniref:DsrE family protein n=1 Tax=unclassified Halomonas TaxID=2609666 RepID=UPI0021E45962|nr:MULTISPECIES: DsrE family protein [unclassified Halomonas]UYF98395.1 DsrE family protein [Halomonas sp. GD1P12]WNL40482.1 DsrE family protein [Halomonas sp. PAMB 3232]
MTEHPARLITLRSAPFASNALREGLDVALVAAAFGEPVTLLFAGEGALALLKSQQAGAPGQKAVLPTLEMLEMYDIEELLVPESSLVEQGLDAGLLIDAARVISESELAALYQRARDVLHF